MLTANKGEWSEFYVLLKLLSEHKLFAADENLNKLADIYYPILAVIAGKGTSEETVYNIHPSRDEIEGVVLADNEHFMLVPSEIGSKTASIFNQIKAGSQAAFTIDEAQPVIDSLRTTRLRASSSQKADIYVVVHDHRTGIEPEIGFSIKSRVGAASTLLNASSHTNFTYRIDGFKGDPLSANAIEGSGKIRSRIQYIKENGGEIRLSNVDSAIFSGNLQMIDSLMPGLVSDLLLAYYSDSGAVISELCTLISQNPDLISNGIYPNFFSHKIKNLLQAAALGMMPGTAWGGEFEANGGYIIVKEDGDIVCYHVYNLEQFRNYLFNNIRFETPSTSRHGFGEVYIENDEAFIKLNLQLRFIA